MVVVVVVEAVEVVVVEVESALEERLVFRIFLFPVSLLSFRRRQFLLSCLHHHLRHLKY